MASAGWLPQQRPELFRSGQFVEEEKNPLTRLVDFLRPDEGFFGLALVVLLAGVMGWSIADSRWILGRDELTSFLIWCAIAAALWGWISSRLDMSPWLAQTLGAVVGALVILELVGMRMPDAKPGLLGWAEAATYSATQAYLDLTWRHKVTTLQYGHFCMILGVLVWGTAQAASYDIFGYRRAVNGVLLLAVVFIANMSLTIQDQFQALVIFSGAALILLILSHAADERASWLAHRIWKSREFRAPNLQGGLVFASMSLAGALVLTTVASSAPLASLAAQYDLQSAVSWLNGWLPSGGQTRYTSTTEFSSTFVVRSTFKAGNDKEFTIKVSAGNVAYHWRVLSYDTFQSNGWTVGKGETTPIIPGTALAEGTIDKVSTTPGREQMTLTVHIQNPSIKLLITANEPDSVNVPATRTTVGDAKTGVNVASYSTTALDYIVSVNVPNLDPTGAGLTEWRLENAGTKYPTGLLARYTQGTEDIGTQGKQLLATIKAWAATKGNTFSNEYDVAKAIQDYLRSPDNFSYNADISSLMTQCGSMSTVDCFAVVKQGFCQQYATTMTMLMRLAGYPARYVVGFLPGAVAENTFIEQVTTQQTHAWTEVYFPTYGWIPFDATGGPGRPTTLPTGTAVKATPTPTVGPEPTDATSKPTRRPEDAGSTSTNTNDTGYAPVLVPGLFLIAILLVVFTVWRRRPRKLDQPDTILRRIVRLASWLGYKPRPTQTVYEYAGMLADVVPLARDSLGVVATSAVEVQYGKRQLSSAQLTVVNRAQGVVQKALLRLALRMPKFGRGRGQGRRPRGRA